MVCGGHINKVEKELYYYNMFNLVLTNYYFVHQVPPLSNCRVHRLQTHSFFKGLIFYNVIEFISISY